MNCTIKINSKEDLYRLSELASKEDYPIYISTAYGQIDAKVCSVCSPSLARK